MGDENCYVITTVLNRASAISVKRGLFPCASYGYSYKSPLFNVLVPPSFDKRKKAETNYLHFIPKRLTSLSQVVYAMVPRPPCSKRVLRMIKIMTDGRSVDAISGNFSWHFLVLECYFFPKLSFT